MCFLGAFENTLVHTQKYSDIVMRSTSHFSQTHIAALWHQGQTLCFLRCETVTLLLDFTFLLRQDLFHHSISDRAKIVIYIMSLPEFSHLKLTLTPRQVSQGGVCLPPLISQKVLSDFRCRFTDR